MANGQGQDDRGEGEESGFLRELASRVGDRVVNGLLAAVLQRLSVTLLVYLLAGALGVGGVVAWRQDHPLLVAVLAVVVGATLALWRWWQRRRARAAAPPEPGEVAATAARTGRLESEASEAIEHFVHIHEGVAHAVAAGDYDVASFLKGSVLDPSVDMIRAQLAPRQSRELRVELALVRVDAVAHRIVVLHAAGEFVDRLQGQHCYPGTLTLDPAPGKLTLEEILARKARANFVAGGYAWAPCELTQGEHEFLVAFASVPFPAEKQTLIELLAEDISASVLILLRLSAALA